MSKSTLHLMWRVASFIGGTIAIPFFAYHAWSMAIGPWTESEVARWGAVGMMCALVALCGWRTTDLLVSFIKYRRRYGRRF